MPHKVSLLTRFNDNSKFKGIFSTAENQDFMVTKKLQCLEKKNNRNEIYFNRTKYEPILGTNNKRGAVISQKQKQMKKICLLTKQYKFELLV